MVGNASAETSMEVFYIRYIACQFDGHLFLDTILHKISKIYLFFSYRLDF